MEIGGGSSSSFQGNPDEVSWAPATPAKPGFSDPKANGSENQLNKSSFRETVVGCWEGNLGLKSQLSEVNDIYGSFSMDNVEMLNGIPCKDLLALGDAAVTTGNYDGGVSGSSSKFYDRGILTLNTQEYKRPNRSRYLFDLNSPPRMMTESPSTIGGSTQFTPVTPGNVESAEHRNVASDIANSNDLEQSKATISTQFEANENLEKGLSDETNLDKTPQPKQRRRKHRPKVVIEGQPKRAKKSTSPNPNGSSTGKRKYVRKNPVNKSTTEETSGILETNTIRKTRNSCRRKINFDDEQPRNGTEEVLVENAQVTENYQTTPKSHCTSPITPSKTELRHTYSRAKCAIILSQETNDKEQRIVPSPSGEKARGSKRERSSKINGIELSDSLEAYLSMFTDYNNGSTIPGLHFPAIYKKRRSQKYQNKAPETSKNCNVQDDEQCYKYLVAFGQMENFKKKRSKGVTRVRDLASFAGMMEGKQWLNPNGPSGHQRYTCMEALAEDFRVSIATKKRTKRSSIVPSSLYHYHKFLTSQIGAGHNPGLTWKSVYDIDALTKQFERLDINSQMVEQDKSALVPYLTRYQEKNALVLYQQDGSIVPFEDLYNPVRRRKPRPKVDLDDETTRVWRLLLENINSQGIDGTDEEKAKWWEEERNVFSGRAASFIARMHLVQGDRRFSQWKGSVVDSVIGVFLTQNVSDHLSSSAFMSLAARYPLKSRNNNKPLHEETSSTSVEETCRVDPDETITWHEKSNHPARDHDSVMLQNADFCEEKVVNSNEVIEVPRNDLAMSETETSFKRDQREVDHFISPQNSINTSMNFVQSTIAQTVDTFGSCSMSNSGEELTDGSKATSRDGSTSFVELFHMKGSTTSNGVYSQEQANESSNKKIGQGELEIRGYSQEQNEGIHYDLQTTRCSENREVEYFELREEQTIRHKKSEEKCASEQSELSVESSQATVHMSSLEIPKSVNNILQAEAQEIFLDTMKDENPRIIIQQHSHENNSEISEVTEGNNMVETSRETAHKVVESNLKDNGNLQATINGVNEGSSKAKRGKNGKAKQAEAEWDSLRIHAQVKLKRERTADTMDSLDYEAVRCADVNEIADTIKERGMNNMLAERMKDFLNRLVRDHGSIDLEWLRDVPPDKAKEYLLSFRGLGLKSVECVRLLTLHHLAFPVDTNVGRIAVRLGWVPLQPLPESLQLHLLELYPVLESIQKYLWPRLCKLDQRTLYELHYQMITFGKVFCTKSKPNCNACPMRGECRHFASAFASARLALPAPDEKNIAGALENKTPDQSPDEVLNQQHLILPPADQQLQQHLEVRHCDPVIEEPATPEPIVEVPTTPEPEQIQQEFDIEDFCRDPEEIPMIKLNIEEFTQNLQTYMEKNMELGEGDMSRALVALTTEAASIPTPKLKNVNQLRTEHNVYELPDSHPLLEGLDKREPDDPCSYLLAIWTPGETADSIKPPEGQCSSQESGTLCNEETCFLCNSIREANSQTVRGTLLIPCRTAMRGSFPLNGTYFQVNEVFADHDSSLNPIDVPRSWLWNLPRRTVYFGTSIPTIFKGLTTEGIQYCFWRGFVCVRGFDQKTRAPRPLMARLHFPVSKLKRSRGKTDES